MSVLSSVIDQLNLYAPIFGGRISIARNINNPAPTNLPEAWVHRWIDAADPSSASNFVVQRVTKQIAVLIASEHESSDEVDPAKEAEDEIFSSLIREDFTLGSEDYPLEFMQKEFVDIADTHVTFRLIFRYTDYIRGQ